MPKMDFAAQTPMSALGQKQTFAVQKACPLYPRSGPYVNFTFQKSRHCELEDVADALAEGRRLEPFAPWHVRHLAESDLLDLVGELLLLRLIGRAHPVVPLSLLIRADASYSNNDHFVALHEVRGWPDIPQLDKLVTSTPSVLARTRSLQQLLLRRLARSSFRHPF
jgi:hypothetical protein